MITVSPTPSSRTAPPLCPSIPQQMSCADGRVRASSIASNNSDSDGVRGAGEGDVEGLPFSVWEGGAASIPLVILSSRFKHASSLAKISNPGACSPS